MVDNYILGLSAFYHDSAVTLIKNGHILHAVQEERFTRKKHDSSFPKYALKYILEEEAIGLDQVSEFVFYDKPLLKFERLLETYFQNSPKGLKSFLMAMPIWIKEKIFLKKIILNELIALGANKKSKILFCEHHLSHSASAYYASPYDDAAILTIDGVGEWATCTIAHGKENAISILKEMSFPNSIGLLYSSFTYYLGFKVNSGEYKLMGLAPYGNTQSEVYKRTIKVLENDLLKIHDDGSITINRKHFNYETGLTMVKDGVWKELLGFEKRKKESPIQAFHCDCALAIQHVTEKIVLLLAAEAQKITGSKNLCLAGGVALNCVANGKVVNSGIFEDVFIQPASGDAGGSLGAAWAIHHIYHDQPKIHSTEDHMQGSYLGPSFYPGDIERMIKKENAKAKQLPEEELIELVAKEIKNGNVVGWMQGRMEFGPRALGNRSILGDPGNSEMQAKINLKIKNRESFRPFAPSVIGEDVNLHFDYQGISPYMLLTRPVSDAIKKEVPANYEELGMKEKLRIEKSDLPGITHVDMSARIQTVTTKSNPKYYRLLEEFKKLSGYGVLINTSFNVRGEPIVCTPEDAFRCFMRTEMDILVVENFIFYKSDQEEVPMDEDWKNEYELD